MFKCKPFVEAQILSLQSCFIPEILDLKVLCGGARIGIKDGASLLGNEGQANVVHIL